jgi:asparagine synthase (glutamine-hydrolysing)
MCGIAGFISPSGQFTQNDLEQMTAALAHRGPDAQGVYCDGPIGFGHRRLSILDLSDSANQPMISEDGRYCILFNGEVYNYREIAKDLHEPLNTTGDTEVLLKAYIQWGPEFLQKLNGMFALAIWDKERKELFIARDRMGIKPLYLYQNGKEFAFASELKALTSCAEIKTNLSLNEQALYHYLYLGFIPKPFSAYGEIEKFPQGHFALWTEKDGLEIKSFWTLEEQLHKATISDPKEAADELERLLRQSVRYRMIADVPFGAFLSGGIDSSTVCALAQAESDSTLKTFSIGFKESKFNEAPFAKEVASALGTDHTEFILSEKEALELFPEILSTYDEPFADSSSIPTMLVSRLARESVTVVLTGDGGDELFHGYGSYNWAQRLSNPLLSASRGLISAGMKMAGPRFQRAATVIDYPNESTKKSHIFSQEQYAFNQQDLKKLWKKSGKLALNEDMSGLARKLSPVEEQALFDLRYYLPDDLLVKVDRASMKYALEARVPVLDHNVVSFALNVDPALKLRDGQSKWLLKQVLYRHLPKALFERPKWGFGMPLVHWLQGPLSHWLDEYLSPDLVKEAGFVDLQFVNQIRAAFSSGKTYLYHRLWLLVLLHKWYKETSVVR